MKKRNILLAVALLGGMTAVMAQNVTVMHMKDGSSREFFNGVKTSTNISFWGHQPDTIHSTYQYGTESQTAPWDVSYWARENHQYIVVLNWDDDVPNQFKPRRGVCFSSQSGVDINNCEKAIETIDVDGLIDCPSHLAYIGNSLPDFILLETVYGNRQPYRPDSMGVDKQNLIQTKLEYGKTYYYRTFAKGYISKNGQPDSVVFYSDEKSFRIPLLAEDCERYPGSNFGSVCPEVAAWQAFFQQHFTTTPTWNLMGNLWQKWMATNEGAQVVDALPKTDLSFDDGELHLLNVVPETFYEWITTREVVANSMEQVLEISKIADPKNEGDSIETCLLTQVTDANPSYNLPNNSYIRMEPVLESYVSHSVTFDLGDAMIPDMKYKAMITFAPETRTELADSTFLFRPSKVRIISYSLQNGKQRSTRIVSAEQVSGTEKTVLECDDVDALHSMRIETRVSSREYTTTMNRIFRISEIRLIPIKKE